MDGINFSHSCVGPIGNGHNENTTKLGTGIMRTRSNGALAACAAVLVGCVAGVESLHAQDAAVPGLIADYPVYQPVEPPAWYRNAVENGTRTADGRPGPSYWQQRVDYEIEVKIEPATALLTGLERIRYHNNSPDTLAFLVFRLYQNVFSEGVERNRTVRLWGGMTLKRASSGGTELQPLETSQLRGRRTAPGWFYRGTVGRIFLPEPVLPGASAEVEIEWEYTVPPGNGAFRMGHIDNHIFNVAQWYPQIAVYDDLKGWDWHPYLGNGEFYLEYGDFDVSITMPEDWLVAATGELQNGREVLPAATVSRLEAATASDEVIPVVSAAELEAGGITLPGTNGWLTWRFRAADVRDFAFATGDRYVWDATGAEVGGEIGRARINALYDPALQHWSEAAAFSAHSVAFFSRHITPYPYPHATAVYGPIGGGMEYPMMVFIGRSRPGVPLYSVLAHEFSHEWFPMVVGSPEPAYAWMDEGLTTFNTSLARADYYGDENPWRGSMMGYLRAAEAGVEAPLMEHTDYVDNGFGRSIAAYSKPGTLMHMLRAIIGAETFDPAYAEYAETWAFKHPMPWDFFAIMEKAAAQDLDWFWQPWFYQTVTLDQAITSVKAEDGSVRVTVANLGGAVLPVHLELENTDGEVTAVQWPVEVWAGTREVSRSVPFSGTLKAVRLDPGVQFPDTDRSQNKWEALEASQ